MTKSMREIVIEQLAQKTDEYSLIEMLNEAYQFGIQSTYAPSDEVVGDAEDVAANYRGSDYGDDDAIPAESAAMMDAQDNCTQPNMGFEPDVFEDGKRVSKHHWYCEE